MVLRKIYVGELFDRGFVRAARPERINKELENLLYQVPRGSPSCSNKRNDVRPIPVSRAFVRRSPVDGFGCVVVLRPIHKKSDAEGIGIGARMEELPTGECARDLFDVFFSVVRLAGYYIVDAHCKQLLELSRKVLVWDRSDI